MIPALLNIPIQQGATFQQTLTWNNPSSQNPQLPGTPIDLTGCKAEMGIAGQRGAAPFYSINSTTPTPNGGLITLGGTAGTIALYIPWQDTMTLQSGVYDLAILMSDGETLNRLINGLISILLEVTPWA